MKKKIFLLGSILALAPLDSFALLAQPPYAEIQTNYGTILVHLDFDKAPISAANFVNYVLQGKYSHTLFHRSVQYTYSSTNPTGNAYGIIQAGGYDLYTGTHIATNPAITNEAGNGLSNTKGTLGMARTPDPNSAASEFFINTVDNSSVFDKTSTNPGYAVFGEVVTDKYNLVGGINGLTPLGQNRLIAGGAYNQSLLLANAFTPSVYAPVYIEKVYLSDLIDATKAAVRITIPIPLPGVYDATTKKTTFPTPYIGTGKVTSSPGGINCNNTAKTSSCIVNKPATTSRKLSKISLKATPDAGSVFTGWWGDCQAYGYRNPAVLDLSHNYNCTATFAKIAPVFSK